MGPPSYQAIADFIGNTTQSGGTSYANPTLLPGWSFSNSAFAGAYGAYADGSLVQFAANTPRHTTLGALYEVTAVTNLALHSQTPASWTQNNTATVNNNVTSPDKTGGTFLVTGGTVTENTSASVQHGAAVLGVTVASTALVTASVFLAAGTRQYIQVGVGNGGNGFWAVVDTVGWTVTEAGQAGGGNIVDAYIVGGYVGGTGGGAVNWYRVVIVGSINGQTVYNMFVNGATAASGGGIRPTYTGTSLTWKVWQADIVTGNKLWSPILTTTATVTRPVDTVSFTTSGNGSLNVVYTDINIPASASTIAAGPTGGGTSFKQFVGGGGTCTLGSGAQAGIPWSGKYITLVQVGGPVFCFYNNTATNGSVITIPAGCDTIGITFSDGTIQTLNVVAGSYTVPSTLNRATISSITGYTVGTKPIANVQIGRPFPYHATYAAKYAQGDRYSEAWGNNAGADLLLGIINDSTAFNGASSGTSQQFSYSDTTQTWTGAITNAMTAWGNTAPGPIINGGGGGTFKQHGITFVQGTFIATVAQSQAASGDLRAQFRNTQILVSVDGGATMTPAPGGTPGSPNAYSGTLSGPGWTLPTFPSNTYNNMAGIGFVHYGNRDYQNVDNVHNNNTYLYAMSTFGGFNYNTDGMYLSRIAISATSTDYQNIANWQWYTGVVGGDITNSANWSVGGTISGATLVLSDTGKCGFSSAIMFVPFCKRYLLITHSYTSLLIGGNNSSRDTSDSLVFFREAPTLSGPWTTVQTVRFCKGSPATSYPAIPTSFYGALGAVGASAFGVGMQGVYGPNVRTSSVMVDGGQNVQMLAAADFGNQSIQTGQYTPWTIPLKILT